MVFAHSFLKEIPGREVARFTSNDRLMVQPFNLLLLRVSLSLPGKMVEPRTQNWFAADLPPLREQGR
jgi:hypothetical protein